MRRSLVVGVLYGCGPAVVFPEATDTGGETTTTGAVTTSGATPTPPTTSSGVPDTTSTTDADASSSGASSFTTHDFVDGGPDGGTHPIECSVWDENCPRGEKCMPWANDGGNAWNATRCSPIADDAGAPGDPCEVEGNGVSGIDDCALHSMCWDVDPETNAGVCVSFCTGSERDPMCDDPATRCTISNEGVLALCLPGCDPILQDCPRGSPCVPFDDEFVCSPDGPGQGRVGDPCEFLDACAVGLTCVVGDGWCEHVACCSAFCSIEDADPPCLPTQMCVPWFEDGSAPAGYEHVGACAG